MPPKRVTITLSEKNQAILEKIQDEIGGSQSAAINHCIAYLDNLDARVARAMNLARKRHEKETRKLIREELERFHGAPK